MAELTLNITALPGIPLVQPGDDLPQLILDALQRASLSLQAGDVLVITSKIVSKAEGRFVSLCEIEPSERARQVAEATLKDPRIVELALSESAGISRSAPNVLITRHRLGFVSANSGIDHSNVEDGDEVVLLLPVDPDASAGAIRAALKAATGVDTGIVISDSHGRPHRMGNVGVAIGVAGLPALLDLRGRLDLYGRALQVSVQGYADMIASASALLTGEAGEGRPVVLLRGLDYPPQEGRASDLIRPQELDLYR